MLLRRKVIKDRTLGVAIIGGGFTGYAAALALVRQISAPLEIAIFDVEASRAGGIAYGRCGNLHVLNVRAGELSCDADRPGDFVDWIIEHRTITAPERHWLEPLFLPRSYIAPYTRSRLFEAVSAHGEAHLWIYDRQVKAVERRRDGYRLHFSWRSSLDADVVILATGYGARRRHKGLDAFDSRSFRDAQNARSAAIIGSGLTMVDTLLSLRAAGYSGAIDVYSRHGRLPESHAPAATPKMPPFLDDEPDLRAMFRAVRELILHSQKEGIAWQSVINSVRHDLQAIWVRLSDADRARFFRHVKPVWDRYRHRLPETMAAVLRQEIETSGTIIHAARVHTVRKALKGWQLCVQPRGKPDAAVCGYDLVFDCTGHRPALPAALMKSLAAQGLARADRFGLGIDVTSNGSVIGADGRAQSDLFALGPLGQGSLMEITAIPEIVSQAKSCAVALAGAYARREFPLDVKAHTPA
ncbi:MAG: FAD/NAD(P)-binding protein [Glycocaulis sp.]